MRKKIKSILIVFSLFTILLSVFGSCKKDEESIRIPVVSTLGTTVISQTKAWVDAEIINDGGETPVNFGILWSKNHEPDHDDNKIEADAEELGFSYQMINLEPATTYYVRAYAKNSKGIGYGEVLSFTTLEELFDIEGNVYHTVIIGSQEWMSENLKTTTYNDGTPIPNITDNQQWMDHTDGAYTWYNNDKEFSKNTYGALYNWYAGKTEKLCPVGWRVSSDEDWFILTHYVGPHEGLKLRSTRKEPDDHPRWGAENTVATDEFGFSALPGGLRGWFYIPDYYQDDLEVFEGLTWSGHWWTSTEFDDTKAISRDISDRYVNRSSTFFDKRCGKSIRCVKE